MAGKKLVFVKAAQYPTPPESGAHALRDAQPAPATA